MKTKDDIKNALAEIIQEINAYLQTVDDATFKTSMNDKWSFAQNIDHLTISNNITALSLNMPKMALKQLYKINNRVSWNYDEVVWKYQQKLSAGAKASLPFQPKISLLPIRSLVDRFWKNSCTTLLKAIDGWSEKDLDIYLVPHPLIGKMTMRELLFFTVYHVGHHLKTMKNIH